MSAPYINVDVIKNAIRDFQMQANDVINKNVTDKELRQMLIGLSDIVFASAVKTATMLGQRAVDMFGKDAMVPIKNTLQKIVDGCGEKGIILIIPPELIQLGVQQYQIKGAGEKKRAKKPTKKPAKKVAKKPTKKVAKKPTKKPVKKTSKK